MTISPMTFGLLAGAGFGAVAAGLMLPMQFADKPTALTAAFLSRFAIGFLIPFCKLPMPPLATGIVVGLLISLPDAVVTKAYVPILVVGALGGALIGWLSGKFVT
ncbi:MAG: hypothetical protein JNJ55_06355 [Betaproteobacteria bacterium]|nr:hypothetical protein [Betaproteobacteria bacterium]